jgi:alpha-methylacyl-CoA racemase
MSTAPGDSTVSTPRPVGALDGVRVLEAGGIGAGPFCGMLLADLGAEVVRVERASTGGTASPAPALFSRGKRYLELDLKDPAAVETLLEVIDRSDVLLEAFRPGVAERLGFGPDVCQARNPRLVYARQTGWGQTGPWSARAGHDVNYIAVAGVLGMIGRPGEGPVPPLNLVGDFGGGGLLTAFGIVSALLERERSGLGQIVDSAMAEGGALLATMFYEMRARGLHQDERGTNSLDGGAPYYDSYETADGQWFALGAVEPQFYAAVLTGLGLDEATMPDRNDRAHWPAVRSAIAATFRTRTRAEWEVVFADVDACATPVLSLSEAIEHPHSVAREAFVDVGGAALPAPAPRLSRTPGGIPAVESAVSVDEVMQRWDRAR